MRTSISCERCRRSKIKCHHSGEPPCRGCVKGGTPETCSLSATVKGQAPQPAPSSSPSARQTGDGSRKRARLGGHDSSSISLDAYFDSVSPSLFIRAVPIFRANFPEHGFLHPADLEGPSPSPAEAEMLRWLAILAISSRYMGHTETETTTDACGADHAAILTRELQLRVMAAPNLYLIQSFLLMGVYEWGEGRGYSAWMHAGIAARMAQVYRGGKLEAVIRSTDHRKPSAGNVGIRGVTLSEIEIRTIWSCFVLDKWLSCGKQRPSMMHLEDVDIPLPQSDEDFAFGTVDVVAGSAAGVGSPTFSQVMALGGNHDRRLECGTVRYHSRAIIRGLEIWSKIHSWIVDGGRRLPEMTEPQNCPWNAESPWGKLKTELVQWREDLDVKMRYPDTKVAAHVHFKRGEVFGYINMLYYLCTLFLGREWLPFLPVGETGPRGPVEPPLLKASAPPGFWVRNLRELLDAGLHITNIARELETAGAVMQTPLTGLCMLTAAITNTYAVYFPRMNRIDEVDLRRTLAAENLASLQRTQKIWRVGEEWVKVAQLSEKLMAKVTSTAPTAIENAPLRRSSSTRQHRQEGEAPITPRSRYDHITLETSMNYSAPAGKSLDLESGPGRDATPSRALVSRGQGTVAEESVEGRSRVGPWQETRGQGQGSLEEEDFIHQRPQLVDGEMPSDQVNPDQEMPLSSLLGVELSEFANSEGWQLWSLWEDPHLCNWEFDLS